MSIVYSIIVNNLPSGILHQWKLFNVGNGMKSNTMLLQLLAPELFQTAPFLKPPVDCLMAALANAFLLL